MLDIVDLRGLWTLLSFVAFVAIVLWAYSGKRKARFDQAARLPLDEEAGEPHKTNGNGAQR